MKKVFIVLLALLLATSTMLALVGCEKEPEGPATSVADYKAKGEWQTINDPVTWEKINAFPIVNDDMTIEEGRSLVVDFFRFAKTALWIPSETYEYVPGLSIEGGTVFGGLPYVTQASGSIYRLMDYMDPETNVVNMEKAGVHPILFCNVCSSGAYVGFGRVINSATYGVTMNMVKARGFLPVGGYTYDDITRLGDPYTTKHILEDNGVEKIFECYALLKKGDGLVNFVTAGHVMMVSSEEAHVEYGADGKIDPGKSYITVIDQTGTIGQASNDAGDTYNYEQNVDGKMTFLYLSQKNYLPFTFAEWEGTDPIEKSETTYTHTGDTITLDQLYDSTVTSNYGICDVYASVYDKNGNEVYKVARRAGQCGRKELAFIENGVEFESWGNVEDLNPKKDYTVKVYAQLYTGERPVLWEGKLAQ